MFFKIQLIFWILIDGSFWLEIIAWYNGSGSLQNYNVKVLAKIVTHVVKNVILTLKVILHISMCHQLNLHTHLAFLVGLSKIVTEKHSQ